MRKTILLFVCLFATLHLIAEDGYRLWLRYDKVSNPQLLQQYRNSIGAIQFKASTPVLQSAKKELLEGLQGLLEKKMPESATTDRLLAAGTPASSKLVQTLFTPAELSQLGEEGFMISTRKAGGKSVLVIAANTDKGVLYGVFHFLRLLQTHRAGNCQLKA